MENPHYNYDNLGNLIKTSISGGNIEQKNYDELSRIIKKTDPVDKIELTYYDESGNLIKNVTDIIYHIVMPDGSVKIIK